MREVILYKLAASEIIQMRVSVDTHAWDVEDVNRNNYPSS